MKKEYLTAQQVAELNEKFGWFGFGDSQGDKSRDFAQEAIEKHELMREAAPDLLAALRGLVWAINLDHPDANDAVAEAEHVANIAIAKATTP